MCTSARRDRARFHRCILRLGTHTHTQAESGGQVSHTQRMCAYLTCRRPCSRPPSCARCRSRAARSAKVVGAGTHTHTHTHTHTRAFQHRSDILKKLVDRAVRKVPWRWRVGSSRGCRGPTEWHAGNVSNARCTHADRRTKETRQIQPTECTVYYLVLDARGDLATRVDLQQRRQHFDDTMAPGGAHDNIAVPTTSWRHTRQPGEQSWSSNFPHTQGTCVVFYRPTHRFLPSRYLWP